MQQLRVEDQLEFGSTVDTSLTVYESLGTVSVYSAMLGPQWDMLCVSHGVCGFPRFTWKSTSDPEVDSRRNCGFFRSSS